LFLKTSNCKHSLSLSLFVTDIYFMENQYKRILLKLSGESLMGSQGYGIDQSKLNSYSEQICEIVHMGIEVCIVIGGGNIFRGLSGVAKGFDRIKGDQMGMLATVVNSLALQSSLEKMGAKPRTFTAIRMEPIGEYYSKEKAI
jgi:uridylate kinase